MITSPTQISNCAVWLDASDTTSLFQLSGGTTAVAADLDPVGYWGDKSGNARHFLNNPGTTASRPTWISSLSTVRFDGSNDYLSSFFNLTYTAQTVFIVVSQRVQVTNARIYTQVSSGGADTSAAGNYIPCWVAGTNQLASATSNTSRSSVSVRSLSSFDVFTSTQSSVSALNFVNGSSGSYFGNSINYTVALSRLGAAATTAANYFNGDISEVIVYNRALTNLERADVEYYLTRKWDFLNSIPRQTYAIKNGLWSDSATWSISAEPSPWNFPLSADNVYTNTFTVTADSSTKVNTIRNSALVPNISAGGFFVLVDGVSLSAVIPLAAHTSNQLLSLSPASTATFVGNANGSNLNNATSILYVPSSSRLNIYGNVYNGTIQNVNTGGCTLSSDGTTNVYGDIYTINGAQISNQNNTIIRNTGNLNIVGSVSGTNIGNSVNAGVIIQTGSTSTTNITGNIFCNYQGFGCGTFSLYSGTLNVLGDVFSTPSYSVNQNGVILVPATSGPRYINVIGNVKNLGICSVTGAPSNPSTFITVNGGVISDGVAGAIINNNSTFVVNLTGNVISNNTSFGIGGTSTTSLSVYGNIINAPNGRQAIYVPRYQVFPSASATYTRHAVNGCGSYADYWTSDATFTYPASSDVVLSTVYNNNALSGSMALPPTSAVALGAFVGTTTGTALITLESLLNQPISSLNTSNSIGARLKNVATTEALSAIANSLDFNN